MLLIFLKNADLIPSGLLEAQTTLISKFYLSIYLSTFFIYTCISFLYSQDSFHNFEEITSKLTYTIKGQKISIISVKGQNHAKFEDFFYENRIRINY